MEDLAKLFNLRRTLLLILLFFPIISFCKDSIVGSCWRIRYKNKGCGNLLREGVSQQRCCMGHYRRAWGPSSSSGPTSSPTYSKAQNYRLDNDSNPGHQNYWIQKQRINQILNDNSSFCEPCKTTCDNVRCGEDQKCVLRNGVPKCVCNPKCHLQHKSAVCGTDGRTYASECQLLKRSCRKKQRLLVVHSGPCQTCSGVKCGNKRSCVLDELLTPRCSKCPKSCSTSSKKRPICGTDDITYPSKCVLKMASCKAGISIKRAYKGPCKKDANCNNVHCWQGETCLTDVLLEKPQCWWCGDQQNCSPTVRLICASDGSTFQSWCAFRHAACRTKKALIALPFHYCTKNAIKEASRKEKCSTSDLEKKKKKEPKLKEKPNKKSKKQKENKNKEVKSSKPVEFFQQHQVTPRKELIVLSKDKENARRMTKLIKNVKQKRKRKGKGC